MHHHPITLHWPLGATGSLLDTEGHQRRARRSLTPALAFNTQVSHQPLEALLVAIVLFPAGEVADVALAPQQTHPGFRGLHHGSVYAHREENDLLTRALFVESPCHLTLDPVARDGTLGQDQQNLVS
jgi:hypothetical protein